jgi:hypothetical protein
MAIIICAGCGHETNTFCSDHINRTDGKADSCYDRLVTVDEDEGNKEWERGCGYKKSSQFDKALADKIIKG